MDEWLISLGLPALFFISFAAATVAPVGSEWLLAALLLQGAEPLPAVAVASVGNFLGACTTFELGLLGREALERRGKLPTGRAYRSAERLFQRFGVWALLLTWLPLVGDLLCLVAGLFRVGWGRFGALTLTGKTFRYGVVALAFV